MLNKKQICIVLSENNLPSTQNILKNIKDDSYIYELRADYLTNLNEKLICDIKKLFDSPVIFTLRSLRHGGKFNNKRAQLTLIQKAIDVGFDYVDIEVDFPFIDHLNKKNTKYIISYHNFNLTPDDKELKKIIRLANKNQADFIKIATQINKIEDLNKLAKLLDVNEYQQKMIIIGMGEKGKYTRLLFPLIGSFLTYVSSNNKILAGQLTFEEIKKYVS